ncbi:MAG: hypothetical protein DMF62_02075 [Acidobacteria bacterium]|nr:MAG: hypothetical protein DMF62_02075 [Acidobacteriota bacterium]
MFKSTWRAPISADADQANIQQAVQSLVIARLMDLAANERAQAQVRGVAKTNRPLASPPGHPIGD